MEIDIVPIAYRKDLKVAKMYLEEGKIHLASRQFHSLFEKARSAKQPNMKEALQDLLERELSREVYIKYSNYWL